MEWISVSDSKPTNIDFVLAVFNDTYVQTLPCWYRNSNDAWYQYDRSLRVNDVITHWMPLPQPPKTK